MVGILLVVCIELKFTVKRYISLTDIMLKRQPTKILITHKNKQRRMVKD